MTQPRQAVLLVMGTHSGHLTAEQIIDAVAGVDPHVHRASVYRTLDTLIRLGVLQHVHLGHGATVYHLTPPTGGGHLHLQCMSCGSITDAPLDLFGGAAVQLRDAVGFAVDLGHVALSGYCRDCGTPHAG